MNSKLFIQAVVLSILGVFVQLLFGLDNAINQISFLILSIAVFLIITRVDAHFIVRVNRLMVVVGVLMLALLLAVADPIRGAQRWFVIGSFNLQPSVVFLPFFILGLAIHLSRLEEKKLPQLIGTLILIAIPVMMVFKQPDLGTALVVGFSLFSLTYLAGFPFKYFVWLGLAFLPLSFLFFKVLKPYQVARLVSFINPNYDPGGINYNSLQSVIAIGSGFLFGKGMNFSYQSKLMFLPEAHTDFVFAALSEAFGLFGSLIITGFLFYFFFSLLKEANDESNHALYRYFVFGLLSYFFIQTVFNIGMNLRLLPVVGVPLPFISYGGSSLLSNFILLAISVKLRDIS